MTPPSGGDSLGLREPSYDGPASDALPDSPPTGPVDRRRWRRLLEWSGTSAPVAVLLLSGIAVGPQGINLLSVHTLSAIAPAVSVALAALGVLVGFSVGIGRTDEGVVVGAGIDAVLTVLIVSIGMGALALAGSLVLTPPYLILIAGSGICAASSLTLPTGNPLEPRTAVTRLVELGVLVPVLLGGLMLAWVRTGSAVGTLALIGAACGLVCAVATAAWLLLTVTSSETEKRVLTIAALLLVGGMSDALSTSALFVGVTAGLFWRSVGGRPLETIGRDVLFIQHPLLVVVLLAAGGNASFSSTSLTFGAAYVVLRVVGRLAGGVVARRTRAGAMPRDVGLHLLAPGVFGAAFALNAVGVAGADASMLLGVVVLGTIGSELVAFRLPPDGMAG
ncbi:MAG: hypothetical protein ABIT71_08780 [Vicinamibacteraceae bacterium]